MPGVAESLAQTITEAPARRARIEEAQNRQKLSQQQLEEFEANKQVREATRDAELVKLEQDTYNLNANLAKQQSYDAFDRYMADGNVRHLNNWVQSAQANPVGKNLIGDIVRFDPLSRDDETVAALRGIGFGDQGIDGLFRLQQQEGGYTLATNSDGTRMLMDMNTLYGVTGFDDFTTDKNRDKMRKDVELLSALRAGVGVAEISTQSKLVDDVSSILGTTRTEAASLLRNPSVQGRDTTTSQGGSSAVERVAERLRQDDPSLDFQESIALAKDLTTSEKSTAIERFVREYKQQNPGASTQQALAAYRGAGKDERTSVQKNLDTAKKARDELDNLFGEEPGAFLDASLTELDSKQERAIADHLNALEVAGKVSLSEADKKNARAMRKLLSLSGKAGSELTDAETGVIDTLLRDVKSYLTNNVQGKGATTAYEQFRLVARNAIFGSQVSAADYKAFNKAVATLGQQTGPVLESLKTQMTVMRDDLAAMESLSDPYVAKARFGLTLDGISERINQISDRIDIITSIQEGRPVQGLSKKTVSNAQQATVKTQVEEERPSLDQIFSGNQ